ncbi:MAG: metallophosphoesterase [Deltaproteobacteria bacterium]|jgi:predicted MPP superfamily phosphohydrolase|nr:metallophosphoesterase [Deltaproteobacteria bacterium]
MTGFRLALLALLILGQLVAWRWWSKPIQSLWARAVLKTVYVMINLVTVLAIGQLYVLEQLPPNHFLFAYLYRPAFTWQFGHVIWLFVAMSIWLIATIRRSLSRRDQGLPLLFRAKNKGFSQTRAILLAWFLIMGMVFYAYGFQLKDPRVNQINLVIPDLPPSLEGLRIAHLSDFHYGLGLDEVELTRRLTQTASLKPDLVILTGDLLDSQSSLARDWREPLKKLQAVRLGVYGVLGNHDMYATNPAEQTHLLTEFGARILRDEAVSLPGAPLTIVGFDDPGTPSHFFRPDSQSDTLNFAAIEGLPAPEGNFILVVRHRPQGLASAAQAGAKLYLAGHTHGGQFQIPWFPRWNLMTFTTPYSQGRFQLNRAHLIINNGLSSAGLPFRLWSWPEIGLITLTRLETPVPRLDS